MTDDEREEAAGRLAEMRDMLSLLEAAFTDIIALAEDEQATGLAFSAMMLQESIVAFQNELSLFVIRKMSEQ